MDAGLLSESSLLPSGFDGSQLQLKRKRSPSSNDNTPLAGKSAKNASNHLTINYLARQYTEDLPLISSEDPLPAILSLLNEYQGVLDRHESLACNLGARPIGPILMSRFDRLFDGPPTILKSHNNSKGPDPSPESQQKVTWLDVVDFARTKPSQFQLSAMSEGKRVCQFYTKQCRVQISEEDFLLVQSGMPQKLIPPQPIVEDEEKELGTLEILEKVLGSVREVADQVAARTRQINHRIRARKQAILDRRASDTGISYTATSPSDVAMANGASSTNGTPNGSSSTPVGFVAVNSRQVSAANGVSPATRNELISKFFTLSDRKHSNFGLNGTAERTPSNNTSLPPISNTATPNRPSTSMPYSDYFPTAQHTSLPPVAIPQSTPNPSLPKSPAQKAASTSRDHHSDKDDPQPHRGTMTAHVETLKKGERIIPPCDRCRRLQMDCVKNLTACQGCTRKHARCSWKDVSEGEVEALRAGEARTREYDVVSLRSGGEDGGYAELNGVAAAAAGVAQSVPTANGVFTSEGVSGVSASVGVEGARSLALDAASAASLAAAAQAVTSLPEPPRFEYRAEGREDADTPASSVAKSEGEQEQRVWNGAS